MTPDTPLAADDLELIERVARRIVELRLEVPAILTIESALPLSLVAGQAMLFFEPFVGGVLPGGDWRRFAKLAERRDALRVLADRIESGVERARAERRAADDARRAARRNGGGARA